MMTDTAITYHEARRDFIELLEKLKVERGRAPVRLNEGTITEAIIIPDNTKADFFNEIYKRGALLVIATFESDAGTFIAKLKRVMRHEKYDAYQLKAINHFTISVCARGQS